MSEKIRLDSVEQAIADIAAGKAVIVVDDEDRENEGDIIFAAAKATPELMAFTIRHSSGVICVPMPGDMLERLEIPLMTPHNKDKLRTAYTISVDARDGVSTGISAADRARTARTLADSATEPWELTRPGHVFPLMAREGGTLVRAGHTEAAVDIAQLAGLTPAGVICEIMNDDGTMARLADLVAFAQRHALKLGSIADLIAHRRRTERLVRRVQDGVLHHAVGGEWRLAVYANTLDYAEHLVLTKGDLAAPTPAMVRVHAVDLVTDVLGGPQWSALHTAMRMIAAEGRGAVVLIRDPRPTSVSERIRLMGGSPRPQAFLRDYGIGAQILVDLGVRDMVLLSNTQRTVVGLEGYGLNIVDQRPIEGDLPGAEPAE